MENEKGAELRLAFFTTSLGTRWESYSQTLIRLAYPSQRRIIVNGLQNWSSLKFLDEALSLDSDFSIHVDEDCFLYDPLQLNRLLQHLQGHDDIVLAGVPDGGHFYRGHNPYACNPFFLVFKTGLVRELVRQNPDWKDLRFREEYKNSAEINLSALDPTHLEFDEFEAFYPFFWLILGKSGRKILYLDTSVDPMFVSTDVHFGDEEFPMVRHLWYLRSWEQTELGPWDKVPHRERYRRLQKDLHSVFGNARFHKTLWLEHVRRLSRRFIGAVNLRLGWAGE